MFYDKQQPSQQQQHLQQFDNLQLFAKFLRHEMRVPTKRCDSVAQHWLVGHRSMSFNKQPVPQQLDLFVGQRPAVVFLWRRSLAAALLVSGH